MRANRRCTSDAYPRSDAPRIAGIRSDQTEGEPVPEKLLNFAKFEVSLDPAWFRRMTKNAGGFRIRVEVRALSSTNAGFATLARGADEWKMRIALHDGLDEPSRLGVLCHELAHILLGHLGADKDLWWPCRTNLTRQTVEIEAESVAYIVTSRLGLKERARRMCPAILETGRCLNQLHSI